MELLFLAVPLWLVLALQVIALSLVGLLYHRVQRRLDRHAESIGNMDAWADDVDEFMRRTKTFERQRIVKSAIDPRISRNSSVRSHPLPAIRGLRPQHSDLDRISG
jgi:hypothetical protein